jgi:pyruvate/2-oxoglutarate dehydrogenase complex dihydrolipoamide acyltransferase (E2) component
MSQPFSVIPFPRERGTVVDAGRLASRRHIIHGLLELDITTPRQVFHNYREQTGESLSFTAFLIACLAQAVEQQKMAHAYRDWRNRLVLFDDVDVVTMIEAEVGGVAIPHILRTANRKTVHELHSEIRSVQARPARSEQRGGLLATAGQRSPAFMRSIFYALLRKNPHWMKKYAGTVIVTSVGLFGSRTGWGLGFLPMHTLGLTIGGISEKPGIVEGRVEAREYLYLTISFDHDIVDGAPAARYAQKLSQLIEGGYGLETVLL